VVGAALPQVAVAVVQLTLWCWPGQSAPTAYDRGVQCNAAAVQRAWPACCCRGALRDRDGAANR